jgi:pimeloyl-ACP methyl ester carboxylesterase
MADDRRNPGAERNAPPLALLFLEPQRVVLERLSLAAARPLLRSAPRGDGQPVLVLPGFTAGDLSTAVLRRYLRDQGFAPHPWLQGLNLGPGDAMRGGLADRIDDLHQRYRRRVSLIGWSLGGIYAREIAKRMPGSVRQVITLGSPFADASRASNVSRLFDLVSGRRSGVDRGGLAAQLRRPPGVPSTAIYSRTDGVVHWRACLEPETDHTENIEIPGSHCGLGLNPLALFAIADRLSQPEEGWKHFQRAGWRRAVYA